MRNNAPINHFPPTPFSPNRSPIYGEAHFYRDKAGWLKVSARGRKFRMTAEQVLNHVLPALAGIKPNP
jgi:hypothetical protein